METPGKTCRRLVAALEQLVAEEQCVVRTGEIDKLRAVQQRADSIITALVALRIDPNATARDFDPILPRLSALQERRATTVRIMDSNLAGMRAKLGSLDAARVRLGKMRNSYGFRRLTNRPAISRLNSSA